MNGGRYFIRVGVLAAAYVGVARLGLMLDPVSGFATLVWPTTGLALAALLMFGYRLWPGIALGACLVNAWIGAPLLVAGGIGVGNTLEALLGACALRRVGFRLSLDRVRDVASLFLLAAVLSPMVSATVGVTSLFLGGVVPAASVAMTWLAWWLGDLVGALVMAPLVLTWTAAPHVRARPGRLAEALALAIALVAVSLFVSAHRFATEVTEFQKPYLLFPVLLWAAVRFGPRGAATANVLVSVIAIWGTALGFGQFARDTLHESLMHLQAFMAVVALAVLVLAAVISERERIEEAILKSHRLLQGVAQGTTDAVFVKDRQGRYLMINAAGARAIGRPIEEVVGRDDTDLFPLDVARALMETDQEVTETGETRTREEVVTVSGATRTFLSTKAPYRDGRGNVIGLIGIARDITERKRAEEAMRESEARLAGIIGSAMDAIITIDADQRVTVFNKAAEQIFRCAAAEALGQSLDRFVPERFRSAHREHIRAFGRTGVTSRSMLTPGELVGLRADGEEFPIEATISQIETGRQKLFTVILRDITERKRAEAERAELLVREQAAQAAAETARRSAFLAEASRRLGASLDDEAALASLAALAVPELADWCLVDLLEADRSIRRVAVAHVDPGKAELARDLQHDRLDPDGAHLAPAVLHSGQPDLVAEMPDAWLRSIARDAEHLGLLRKIGPRSCMSVSLVAGGRTLGVISFIAAESGRRYGPVDLALAEELAGRAALAVDNARLYREAQAAEQRYRELVDGLDAIVWEADAVTRQFTFVSRRARELLGYPVEQWLTEPDFWVKLIHPEDRERTVALCLAATREARDNDLEYRVLTADGRVVWLRDIVYVAKDAEGPVRQLRGLMVDITAQKQAAEALRQSEGHLRQAQKMEAIGRLAGGVAHDFNNLLTAITGYTELLLRALDQDAPRRHDVEEIRKATDRAAALTRQLLAFSRQQVLQPKVLDLNAVVADVEKMLRRLIGEDIDLVVLPVSDLGRVQADPGQLGQVLVNLALNARDAMPQGGKLTIETANVELDETYARRHTAVQPGPYVRLAVSDTGCGMDAETQARIFEPFFTTKGPGEGTGLGLSTVYGIVKQSGGNIWVYSEPGQGSTFKIYLPRVEEAVETPAVLVPPAQPVGGSETILLVEDDESVRLLARRVLEQTGYAVLEAREGNEALRVSEEHKGPIALVLTDLVMPGMSGPEAARRLAGMRPDMKVLFMSGYTDSASLQQRVFDPGTAFLEKPFTPNALTRKVREVLDTRGGPVGPGHAAGSGSAAGPDAEASTRVQTPRQ